MHRSKKTVFIALLTLASALASLAAIPEAGSTEFQSAPIPIGTPTMPDMSGPMRAELRDLTEGGGPEIRQIRVIPFQFKWWGIPAIRF